MLEVVGGGCSTGVYSPIRTHSYVDKIDVVKLKDYVPSVQDVLRSRVRTSGILDEHYVIDKVDFV